LLISVIILFNFPACSSDEANSLTKSLPRAFLISFPASSEPSAYSLKAFSLSSTNFAVIFSLLPKAFRAAFAIASRAFYLVYGSFDLRALLLSLIACVKSS